VNGQGVSVRSGRSCRPTARFAFLVRLVALHHLHDHTVKGVLCEFTLLLRTLRAFRCPNRLSLIRARRGAGDAPVVALRLDRLRDLQYVTQAFMFNDRALIDLGQPVVLPARQHPAICADLDASVRILPHVDVGVDQFAVLRRVIQQVGVISWKPRFAGNLFNSMV
jgi:hypothetical protein